MPPVLAQHKFIHIDMDAYFVSVELLDAPHLRQQPVAVGGAAAQRGVVSTANYLARQFGIKSGMSMATAQRLCPELVVLPVRFERYEAITRELDLVFRQYTDRIEFFSLDEASLDVTGQPYCNGSATHMAAAIRCEIEARLGLTASAGIAPLKYLAKIASNVNKPNGQFVIAPNAVAGFLADLDIRKIPGVGPRTWAVLEQLGCRRCGEVDRSKIPLLLHHLGVHGYQVWERCQGLESYQEQAGDTRSIGVEHTLASDCSTLEACEQVMAELLPTLRERMAQLSTEEQVMRNQVKLKFDDFSIASTEAPACCLDVAVLHVLLLRLWNGRRRHRAVRLIGIAVKVRRPDVERRQMELEW